MKYLAKKEKKKGKYRKERVKKQAAVDTEEIRTKDFFDCVAPGVVKFFADSYLIGDSYRSTWHGFADLVCGAHSSGLRFPCIGQRKNKIGCWYAATADHRKSFRRRPRNAGKHRIYDGRNQIRIYGSGHAGTSG